MADPFEVRVRFTNQLRQLNASVTSAQKAAQYALKNREMAEDLHSCILEQLGKNNMNTRANIMYFIEHFLDMAHKEGYTEYIRMIQRDIIRVVDAVAPDDGSGAANVKVVRKVLQALLSKDFLDRESVTQIEEVLKERDTAAQLLEDEDEEQELVVEAGGDVAMTTPPPPPPPNSNPSDVDNHHPPFRAGAGAGGDNNAPFTSQQQTMLSSATAAAAGTTSSKRSAAAAAVAVAQLDRKQREQRIEEDRERHKRQRENIWAVPQGEYAELDKMWEETSDLGEDDERAMKEEWEEWKAAARAKGDCGHNKS